MSELHARIALLEHRLAFIEAFLDDEMRARQHFAMTRPTDQHASGPVNYWHGCSGYACPIDRWPSRQGPYRAYQSPIGYDGWSIRLPEAYAVKYVSGEGGVGLSEASRLLKGQEDEGDVQARRKTGEASLARLLQSDLLNGPAVRPSVPPNNPAPITGGYHGPWLKDLASEVIKGAGAQGQLKLGLGQIGAQVIGHAASSLRSVFAKEAPGGAKTLAAEPCPVNPVDNQKPLAGA